MTMDKQCVHNIANAFIPLQNPASSLFVIITMSASLKRPALAHRKEAVRGMIGDT